MTSKAASGNVIYSESHSWPLSALSLLIAATLIGLAGSVILLVVSSGYMNQVFLLPCALLIILVLWGSGHALAYRRLKLKVTRGSW